MNKTTDSNDIVFRYSTIGFIAGLILYVAAMLITFSLYDIKISFPGIAEIYRTTPGIWIFTFLPVVSIIIGAIIGKVVERKNNKIQEIVEKDQEKTKKILKFSSKLINQETNIELDLNGEEQGLNKTLIKLRDTIKLNKETEEKRRKEDEQRHWVSEGLAKFGDILRATSENMEELSYKIISNLVKYIDANQGGFFLLNDNTDEDVYFELTACYAYNRKKYADKRIEWGEGLVGTCALERKTIYLTEIPDSYIFITSGLGKANPKSLLIVPLIVNEEIHGIMEIASFNEFEKFEIEFVEKVCESIATTISSVKINMKTSQLLRDSQNQAETLASQEEQMRQNMEELQATQEEATRQSQKFVSFTNSVNHTLIRAEYATDGTLLYANTKFLKKLGYSGNKEVEGKHISMFINEKDREWFESIWENLSKGGRHFEGYMKHMTKQNQDLWTMATYTCVRNEDGSVEKILFLAIDTTDQKKQSLDYEGQIQALDRSSMKVIYSPEGNVMETNKLFLDIMKYPPEEARQKNIYDFIDKQYWTEFKKSWKKMLEGEPLQEQYKCLNKEGEEKWYSATFSAVYDLYDEVSKIIFTGHDITIQKQMEIESKEQAEKLKVQEEKLRQSGDELQKKLEHAKLEMEDQFKEIEHTKLRNERTLEGALDAIVTINQFGNIEFFNKAAEDLWAVKRRDVLGRNAEILFSEDTIKNDEFVKKFVNEKESKIIGERKEVTIKKLTGEEVPVLFLLSDATVDDERTYTAFIQNVEVELF
jgi:PAS domain S-box-containing protein